MKVTLTKASDHYELTLEQEDGDPGWCAQTHTLPRRANDPRDAKVQQRVEEIVGAVRRELARQAKPERAVKVNVEAFLAREHPKA